MSASGILRWGSLIVFVWSFATGRWTVALVSSLILLAFLVIDALVRIGHPAAMRDFLSTIAGGAIGGVAFTLLAIGFPVLFLIVFHDWNPTISRTALQILISAPGLILGIAAWILIYRYWGRRRGSAIRLTSDARRALGRVSPELFKLRLETSLAGVLDEYYTAGQELVEFAQWGESLDLTDVLLTVQNTDPIRLANAMAARNPGLPLGEPLDLPVFEPLKAVLRTFVNCDPFRPNQTEQI
jgi:hypothetical protein